MPCDGCGETPNRGCKGVIVFRTVARGLIRRVGAGSFLRKYDTPDRSARFFAPGRTNMTRFARRIGIGLLASALGCGIAVAQGWQHVSKVRRVEKLKDGVELTTGAAKVRITIFRDGMFRVRVAPNGTFPKNSSWAVIESPEPPAFKI